MDYSKTYPYLKALLDGLIEAAPNWTKAPAKFISSLSEQLKDQSEAEVRQLEQEIKGITKDELEVMLKEAGCDQREHIELIVKTVELIPGSFERIDHRFDRVDNALEEITNLLKLKPGKSIQFPFPPHFTNITDPELNFVGRVEMLETITEWYKNIDVRIGALIGLGGEGKSAIIRKWYDSLEMNSIEPDGIFWWGFYRNPYLERFLDSLLGYLAVGRIDLNEIKSTWAKVDKIKEFITEAEYLIILDGLEEMQKVEESGEKFGCMSHMELSEILRFLADAKNRGLLLITSRYPLTDIKNWEGSSYQKLDVERLSIEEGRALFGKVGVKGSREEIDAVIEEYKGHALSLSLLANYLVQDFKCDIKGAKDIPPFHSDKEAGGKAHRMLLWYAKQLKEEQLAFMKIFSLFRKAVNENDFEGVFRPEMETSINKPLREMSLFSFKRMVDNLWNRRLITKSQDDTYTTHPLVKKYFESIFDELDKKLCHKHIYHFIGTYAPELPETLEEMQPLFEQVYHGCAAGLYDEVYNAYQDKIHRYDRFYLTYNLSAWISELSLIHNFFPLGDLSKMPKVSKMSDQCWLLNEAGMVLLHMGRSSEAEGLISRHNDLRIRDKDYVNASAGYRNLAHLQYRTGRILEAITSSKRALEMAEKVRYKPYEAISRAYLAYTLFLSGQTAEVITLFQEADWLQRQIEPDKNGLYGFYGVSYADTLAAMGMVEKAVQLSNKNLQICLQERWPARISRCQRLLASLERIKGNYVKSSEHINNALEIARKVRMPFLEIEVLCEKGRLRVETKDYNEAESYLKDALTLCNRTGFKLYEPEAEVVLAKIYFRQGDIDKTKEFANSAYEKAATMHYHWPKVEAEELLKEISH